MGVMTEPAADAPPLGWPPEDVALYEAHAPRLLALAAALAGPSDADDVVANAVLRSFTSPGWRTVANPGAYLTRAVVNEVRAGHRSAMRRSAREARYAGRDETTRPDGDPDPDLLAALARLPVQQRAVTFLTYWADLTPAGVAAELGISEGSVRKYLARARSTLRKGLL
ncbi:MAG: putative polymerase subfamily sigma factor [Ilumatobacteraceae bacterium]|nr:putative polymerase subfamily sigma factor [Ilumatobacteraceae bacterium]